MKLSLFFIVILLMSTTPLFAQGNLPSTDDTVSVYDFETKVKRLEIDLVSVLPQELRRSVHTLPTAYIVSLLKQRRVQKEINKQAKELADRYGCTIVKRSNPVLETQYITSDLSNSGRTVRQLCYILTLRPK